MKFQFAPSTHILSDSNPSFKFRSWCGDRQANSRWGAPHTYPGALGTADERDGPRRNHAHLHSGTARLRQKDQE